MRGEFGYWVFEGDWQPAQRPSWNYRAEDGGGIIVDMFPHWNYVLENLFGKVRSVYTTAAIHVPDRWDEQGEHYEATAEDAAYGTFELEGGVIAQINSSWTVRVNRDELVEFHVDGTHGSAVVGLFGAKIQHRNVTPKPVWNPDLADAHDYAGDWSEVPVNDVFDNGFKKGCRGHPGHRAAAPWDGQRLVSDAIHNGRAWRISAPERAGASRLRLEILPLHREAAVHVGAGRPVGADVVSARIEPRQRPVWGLGNPT